MLKKFFLGIITTIVLSFLTIIGVVLRGIQLYCYQGDEKTAAGSTVFFVLSIVFYILGFLFAIYTLTDSPHKRKDHEIAASMGSVIFSIAIPIFFIFYIPAGMLVGKIVMTILGHILGIIIVIVIIMFLFSFAGSDSGGSTVQPFMDIQNESEDKNPEDDKERRRKEVQEKLRRTTGLDPSDIHVNSDGSSYYLGNGDWNKVSSDERRYEDDEGNWHNFEV